MTERVEPPHPDATPAKTTDADNTHRQTDKIMYSAAKTTCKHNKEQLALVFLFRRTKKEA